MHELKTAQAVRKDDGSTEYVPKEDPIQPLIRHLVDKHMETVEARLHALEFSTIQMRGELDLNKGAVNWLMKQSGWPGRAAALAEGQKEAMDVEAESLRAQRDNAIRRAEDAEASEAALRERLMSPQLVAEPTGAGADALRAMGWTWTSDEGWTPPAEPAKLVAVRQPTGTEYHRMREERDEHEQALASCRELLKLRTDRLEVVERERDEAQDAHAAIQQQLVAAGKELDELRQREKDLVGRLESLEARVETLLGYSKPE